MLLVAGCGGRLPISDAVARVVRWPLPPLPPARAVRLFTDEKGKLEYVSMLSEKSFLDIARFERGKWHIDRVLDADGEPVYCVWSAPFVVSTPAGPEVFAVIEEDDVRKILSAKKTAGRWRTELIGEDAVGWFAASWDPVSARVMVFFVKGGALYLHSRTLGGAWSSAEKIADRVRNVEVRRDGQGRPMLLLSGERLSLSILAIDGPGIWTRKWVVSEHDNFGVDFDVINGAPTVFWLSGRTLTAARFDGEEWSRGVVREAPIPEDEDTILADASDGIFYAATVTTAINIPSHITACRVDVEGEDCMTREDPMGTQLEAMIGVDGVLYGVVCDDDACRFEVLLSAARR